MVKIHKILTGLAPLGNYQCRCGTVSGWAGAKQKNIQIQICNEYSGF